MKTRRTDNPMKSQRLYQIYRTTLPLLLLSGILSGNAFAETNGTVTPQVVTESQLNDVMEGKMPPMPKFAKLAKKHGFLRGYVKDVNGKPLAGAYIMILPPAVFGSGFTKRSIIAKTDANGLYEVPVPLGGCTVYCAGYAVNYHGVRYALPLHAADGSLDIIDKNKGDIENFVLLSYGIANESSVSENPVYSGGYFGASFTVGYASREPDDPSYPHYLNLGADIEVTLTPDGPLLDGSTGRPLIIRGKVTYRGYMQVNNVPIGQYKISVRMIDRGKIVPLRLKDNSNGDRKGGMQPRETTDTATLLFRSDSADPQVLRVTGGNMERLSLLIKKIE
jgi:hypothetical protein